MVDLFYLFRIVTTCVSTEARQPLPTLSNLYGTVQSIFSVQSFRITANPSDLPEKVEYFPDSGVRLAQDRVSASARGTVGPSYTNSRAQSNQCPKHSVAAWF